MTKPADTMLAEVAHYYSRKLAEFGDTPRGVDWNGQESQALRFSQLCKVMQPQGHLSVNDLGCGYGAFYDYLAALGIDFTYLGWDVATDMVKAARARLASVRNASFEIGSEPTGQADYGVASGIFNVKLETPLAEWRAYIEDSLDKLDRTSRLGFAFNCLTSYSDPDKLKPHLYYADPCQLFDFCKRRYSRNVALLHDYGLYEFTLLVRKATA